MTKTSSTRFQAGFLASFVSAITFSTLGIFAKLLYATGFSVATALAWRFMVAALVLWTFVGIRARKRAMRGQKERLEPASRAQEPVGGHSAGARRGLLKLFLLGLLGFSPQAGLFFLTVKILDPGITSLLLYLYPSFVFLIGFVAGRHRSNRVQLFALALSLVGCLITFWTAGSYPLAGIVLGVVVAITYAAYLVVGDIMLRDEDPIWATAVIMTAASFVYFAIALASGNFVLAISARQALLVLCIAIISTCVPIVTLFLAMQRIGARDTSIVSTVEPIFTNLFSALLFGELMTERRVLGGALILAGVVMLNLWGQSSAQRKIEAAS